MLSFLAEISAQVVAGRHLTRLEEIMRCAPTSNANWSSSTGENNHVHLLVHFPPKVALPNLVNSLKGVSSGGCAKNSPTSHATTTWANRPWTGPYLAGSVGGAPLSVLHQYIDQQNRPG